MHDHFRDGPGIRSDTREGVQHGLEKHNPKGFEPSWKAEDIRFLIGLAQASLVLRIFFAQESQELNTFLRSRRIGRTDDEKCRSWELLLYGGEGSEEKVSALPMEISPHEQDGPGFSGGFTFPQDDLTGIDVGSCVDCPDLLFRNTKILHERISQSITEGENFRRSRVHLGFPAYHARQLGLCKRPDFCLPARFSALSQAGVSITIEYIWESSPTPRFEGRTELEDDIDVIRVRADDPFSPPGSECKGKSVKVVACPPPEPIRRIGGSNSQPPSESFEVHVSCIYGVSQGANMFDDAP
jgi:hypothetical protein